MTTPQWQPGNLYSPGALVRRKSSPPTISSQLVNGNFNDGETGWTLGTNFDIVNGSTHFDGTWALTTAGSFTGTQYTTNEDVVPVTPGTTYSAQCRFRRNSGNHTSRTYLELLWEDASHTPMTFATSSAFGGQETGKWYSISMTGKVPVGAAFMALRIRVTRPAGSTDVLFWDTFSWNYTYVAPPVVPGLIFKAVQPTAGYSAATEPAWPDELGEQVVDNEVTWEGVVASSIEWKAHPIMKSGSVEPTFPGVVGAEVLDGTFVWRGTSRRVTDVKCPNSTVVQIAASKIFAADGDIIAYSATVNPLDWSTLQDAGYLPFGLNSFGSTPCTALGLYRSNLVAFNSQGYQMWQVDEDPANMAFLDGSPADCPYSKTPQPVSNDLVFLSAQGIRSIGIAGASTNLQAGFFGKQVDPLVKAAIAALVGDAEPRGLFWPGAGQYWLFFDNEAFVLTMNGGVKDMSWSRYVFPDEVTDWAILGVDLYLRAHDLVWRVSEDALRDDVNFGSADFTTSGTWTKPAGLDPTSEVTVTVIGGGGGGASGSIYPAPGAASGGGGGGAGVSVETYLAGDLPATVAITVGAGGAGGVLDDVHTATDDLTPAPGAAGGTSSFGALLTAPGGEGGTGSAIGGGTGGDGGVGDTFTGGDGGSVNINDGDGDVSPDGYGPGGGGCGGGGSLLTAPGAGADAISPAGSGGDGGTGGIVDNTPGEPGAAGASAGGGGGGGGGGYLTADGDFDMAHGGDGGGGRVTIDHESVEDGVDFEGSIIWPYLDLGALGSDKNMVGFDLVCTGEVTVTFGYSQNDTTLVTDPYTIYGDTLPGDIIPMPLSGPSFQMRLTFSPNQAWQWDAANIYINEGLNP